MFRLALRSLVALTVLGACASQGPSVAAQGRGFRGGRGPDAAFAHDRDTFHYLLERHAAIEREVINLPNGVATITRSDDAEVAAKIQDHVAAMHERIKEVRPIRMRDPLFALLFRHAKQVRMGVENVPGGVKVWEVSDDPYTIQLIQAHAKVVSKFVERGFAEAPLNHEPPARAEESSAEAVPESSPPSEAPASVAPATVQAGD
jgi:hypothetical protein